MPQGEWPKEQLASLAARRDALRQAARVPGADPEALLDAAFTELDGAIEALGGSPGGGASDEPADGLPETVRAERRLLHAAFQQAPVALFLLERDGTIRRANAGAATLLGVPSGYATGKPLTNFVDLASRAAVQTQLAAVARTGGPRRSDCRLLGADGPADVTLTATAIDLPGDPPVVVVTAVPLQGAPAAQSRGQRSRKAEKAPDNRAGGASIASMTQRMDMVTTVTRLLLDNSTFSEAVTLQRCARLLAGDLADWVIIDMERAGSLRRQSATGSRQAEQLARAARSVDPDPDSVPWQVHQSGKSVLLAHADDPLALGAGPDGTPLLLMLGAASLICVPISDGTAGYGTVTLARQAGSPRFTVTDLGLAEELGRHLAVAIRVDRMFRHRSEVAETLQASLLPSRLPTGVPGLEFGATYIGATQSQEISGDFYDVFRTPDGWALAVGDVCGKGQDAAAVTAAARHAIRALAHVKTSPADVLAAANDVLVAGDHGERFVTAKLAFLRKSGRRVQVRLGSAGHPGPAIVRADGRVEIVEAGGLPLGLFDDAHPSETDLDLGAGDLLFFYTDGVTEARSEEQEFFEERLADSLAASVSRSAPDTVRAVQELVTAFSQGELRDDVTILAVKVEPAG
ncbi:MAG TPA: SpoIIE family protein phosphatase [Trebonia sp.]|jgi:serine phosphatase RsbU (regulator of sigma subunit)/PAS domain-containing protein